MAWNIDATIELIAKVDGQEIALSYHPQLEYFEGIFPRQFDETYFIELYAKDVAGNLTYLTCLHIEKGRIMNISELHNILLNIGLLKRKL